MGTFFSTLGRHGFKMWGTYLLGYFFVWVLQGVATLLLYLFGLVTLLASVGISTSLTDTDGMEKALESASPGLALGLLLFVFLYYLLLFLFQSFHSAGSTGMATEAVLDNSSSLSSYFRNGFRYFWKMFLQIILMGLLFLPALLPLAAIDLGILFATEANSVVAYFLWALWALLLIAFLYFISLFLYAPFIMIAENKGPWESIRDSMRAARKSYGQNLITLLLLIASFIPFMVLYLVLSFLFFLPLSTQPDPGGGAVILGLLLVFILLLTLPFMEVVTRLIVASRYKQHMRKWVVPEDPNPAPEVPYGQSFPPQETESMEPEDSYQNREPLYPQNPGADPFLPPEENRQPSDSPHADPDAFRDPHAR